MTQLHDRIAQFRKMATDDPDNELGHFRLGQLYMEANQFAEAADSFRRTLEIAPQFSKVFQLLAACLLKLDQRAEAVEALKKGHAIADERGDRVPRDEMARMLQELGEGAPAARPASSGPGGGFACQRPGCSYVPYARPLTAPPVPDEVGQRIQREICADCWNDWLKNQSIKVINELHLDLSDERAQAEYDRYMFDFFGFEGPAAVKQS
jgi:Fe-S cluster biosynthesis and repair protein YggX/Tfp pilus assembly protein PilF